ncbi:hypothetical protein D1614_20620 [Maribellus luteus]|uniref:PH domain-containing protein n=1 Tax=Maribellus luteus TaxID=2305463 RepID=A0A399SPI3_9BACT|nr:hypothetical protein [Maribellus luteus]RIJ45926.1 hypothetical protein D1614_20620 [Maribellus luteus]
MGNDFILEFDFDKRNEWKILRKSILFYIGTLFGFLYFFITRGKLGLYLGFGFLLVTIPQLVLHFQYRLNDRNKKITVNHSQLTVRVDKNGKTEKEFQFKEIDKIVRHKSQNNENNMTYALPPFFYNYTEIILVDGQKIIFTDFLTKTLGLKDVETSEKLSLFNLIRN